MFFEIFLLSIYLTQLQIEGIVVCLLDLGLFELNLLKDFVENLIDGLHVLDFLPLHVFCEFEAVAEELLGALAQVVERCHDVVCVFLQDKG